VALLAVVTEDFMEASILGLALSYSFSLTSNLKFATRMMAATEANMNATERVKYVNSHCRCHRHRHRHRHRHGHRRRDRHCDRHRRRCR
jgi:hypothetical protein